MGEEGGKDTASQESRDKRPSSKRKPSYDNREEHKPQSRKHRSSSRDLHENGLGCSERKSSRSKPDRRRSKDDDGEDDGLGSSGKRSADRPSRRKSKDSHEDELVGSSRVKPESRKSKDSDDGIGGSSRHTSSRPRRRKSRDSHEDELGGSSRATKPERMRSKDHDHEDGFSNSGKRSSGRPSRRKSRDSDDGSISTSSRQSSGHKPKSQDSNDSLANHSEPAFTEDQRAKASSRRKVSAPAMPGAFVETTVQDRAVRRKGDGSKTQTPSLVPAPGVTTVSDSDRNIKRKASKYGSTRQAPGAQRSSKSGRAASKKGSMNSSRHRSTPDSMPSQNTGRLTEAEENEICHFPLHGPNSSVAQWTGGVEALEASAVDEMEGAPQRQREEGPNEGRDEKDNLVFVASPAPPVKKGKKYKYMLAAFVVFAVAAGVITWLVVSGKPQEVTIFVTYDPPTEEDCVAISKGMETADQFGTTVKYFGVGMEFATASTIDLEFLQTELQLRIQRDALPGIAGCDLGSSPIIENNIFVIENAVLKSISIEESAKCSENSERRCSPVYLELDLFSKDDDVQSEVLVDLLTDLFQDEELLVLLNLASPVERIFFTTAFEILPSVAPSSSPSIQDDGSPSQETCDAIANGTPVSGQEDVVVVVKEYDILMDATFDSETEDLSLHTMVLEEEIQRILMPMLAGCSNQRRRLQLENYVVNALADVEVVAGAECLVNSERPCYRYVANLTIYFSSTASTADFMESIDAEFRAIPLVERLNLLPPFKAISIVRISKREEISANPSGIKSNEGTSYIPDYRRPHKVTNHSSIIESNKTSSYIPDIGISYDDIDGVSNTNSDEGANSSSNVTTRR
ncbi:MAG: hypothetical protein SGBAC_012890 [Bacillariaceae sp.]